VDLINVKNNIIDKLINIENKNNMLSEVQKKALRKEYEGKILNNNIMLEPILANGTTNALDFNTNNYNIFIDIMTIFEYINKIESNIDKNLSINQSSVNNLKSIIRKVNDTLDQLEHIVKSNKATYIVKESFRNSQALNDNKNMYTERYGEKVNSHNHITYLKDTEQLCLPYLRQNNMLYDPESGVYFGDIKISKQLGSGFNEYSNMNNTPNKLIETTNHSFWSNIIISDEPIRISYTNIRPVEAKDIKDFYYGVKRGALCELEITFESITKINEIMLNPYSQFPFELVAIRYKHSDDIDDDMFEVVYPDNELQYLRSHVLDKPAIYRFSSVNCKKLYIVFNQINFTKQNITIDEKEILKNKLLFEDKNIQIEDKLFIPMYKDKYENNNLVKLIDNKEINLNKLLNDSMTRKSFIKYVYQYGFYNLKLNYSEFDKTGVYVSNKIQFKQNIKSIKIKPTEIISYNKNISAKNTDIEYYITYKESPNWNDWQPILPYNTSAIYGELLQMYPNDCMFRFKATSVIGVYRDNIKLSEGLNFEYVIKDGLYVGVNIPDFNFFSKYTVSYVPQAGQDNVMFVTNDEINLFNSKEIIQANNSSIYEVNFVPYISPNVFENTHVTLYNKETGESIVQKQGSDAIRCVTNVYNPEESYKNFDKLNSNFEYYINNNYVFFNQNIDDKYEIEINYKHFINSFFLKAIFRRNTLTENWNTPVLDEIEYEIELL
jgi:hypothetical protein